VYDYLPTRLRDDGFNIRTLKRLGIGYDRSKHRITFPIRDGYGNLVGLAGRAVIGPRYKVYRGGYKDEAGNMIVGDFGPEFDQMFPGYELKKSLHLWNAYNVLARQEMGETAPVIIVEGYKAAIWLIQHGYQHVVALMGSALSMIQLVILGVLYTGEFILFLDADKPGVDATKRIGQWLIGKGYTVSVARYPDPMMRQPDDMSDAGLGLALEERKRFATWDLLREKQLQPVSG
jgi:DNA primase